MNLCRTVDRTEARFGGVAGTADRVRCEEVYGSRPPPPLVFGRHRPQTSRMEKGMRRPSKRRQQCCGRGEAAGNCVNVVGAFSTTLIDRVPHVLGTRAEAAPELLLRPSSAGRIEHDCKTRRQRRGEHSRGRATSPWPAATSSSRTSLVEQPEPVAREDREDLSCRQPQRRQRGVRAGFSLAVSPIT